MKFYKLLSFLFVSTFLFVAGNAFSQAQFIENKGQWDKQVKFMTYTGNGSFFLQNKGFTVLQHSPKDLEKLINKHRSQNVQGKAGGPQKLRSHAYSVQFVGADNNAQIIPDRPLPSVNNYFIGNDKSKWASNCKIYGGVTYKNVYPNIDVRYYSEGAAGLKYDIIVRPGGDINKIALQYKGADNLTIKNKELVIKTSVGENKELYPYTYQVVNNERKEIETRYEVKDNIVRFKVKGHSPGSTLIIDPVQAFYTYSGSNADNWGFTATYGPDGSFFSGGIAFGQGFPVSPGAYDTTFNNGKFDIAIMKLTPDLKNRVYATYIGGNGDEQPHSIIVDPQGNLIIAGRSNSLNYPTTVSPSPTAQLMDIVVTKLNAAGNGIIGSMKIGGSENDGLNIRDGNVPGTFSLKRNYGDDARSEVIIDGAGNIYVASCTQSLNFPTTPGVVQTAFGGKQDGVVIKLNANCNSVLWSSFLGGTGNDAAYVLALGNTNNLYVAGGTASLDMPQISASSVIKSNRFANDTCDGFIVELNINGSNAPRGTYLGTDKADQIYGIQTDRSGNVYVMGTTEGSWFIKAPNVFDSPDGKQFIAKIKPDLSDYIYSTVFGPSVALPNISPTAFLVDRCENVYVSGWGGNTNTESGYGARNVKGMKTTPDALQINPDPSGSDFYFIVVAKGATQQLYGTFFGENNALPTSNNSNFGEHVDGGTSRFDENGIIYQAICANCAKPVIFPGTLGSWSPLPGAGSCNLGMLKIEMNFAGVSANPQASINGVVNDTAGCIPLKVDFTDINGNAKSYIWNFGDGTGNFPQTTSGISHTYTVVGTYLVTLVAIDSTSCNIADTAYLTIRAGDNIATLDFIPTKPGLCTDLSYIFTNTSNAGSGTFKPNTFTWDFGDGTARITTSQTPPISHTYASAGTYIVKLILTDTTFCNSPDSISKPIRVSPIVKAQFTTPATGCVPYNAVFQNTSSGGLNFLWDFGDGTTSTTDNPTHLYTTAGIYTVKLFAFDSTSCNKIDSTSFTISVLPIPVASFTFSPNPAQENTATQFTNQSFGATKYMWRFGDGDSSTDVNPIHLFNATGTYNVCLTAINAAGCSDTICIPVSAIINPLLDVPSAFTPGKVGANSVVSVKGFGIKDMHWIIYNRWGQKVFETTNRSSGWDGYFKGKLQPMEVYVYTLDVVFSDGTKLRKTGDITLIK